MLFLTPDEVFQLAGYAQKSRQKRALTRMGVPFKVNPIGEILVSRAAVETMLSGKASEPNIEVELNLDFLKTYGKKSRHTKPGLLA